MGGLARAIAERKAVDPLAIWAELFKVSASKAGPNVNLETALQVSTAFACLRVISQGCSQVPFKLFRETVQDELKNIQPAKDHALYDLLGTKPNDWSTSYEFRETLVLHAALGDAYVFKNQPQEELLELIILNPAKVAVEQKPDWSIVYKVTGDSGQVREFPQSTIWHVRGPSWNGFSGLHILKLAKEALGLSIATEESHSKLHAKGVNPSGTYSVEGNLNPQQYADLKAWILKENAGSDNAGMPMILDRGAKWLSTAMSGLDAQHLETRNFQIGEICRFFGVNPIMVGYSDKTATYASAEQMFIAHQVHTLAPWYARIEQSADVHLLTPKERRKGYYFKFVASGMLRGTAKDRAEYLAKALGAGGSPAWMTQDEVRAIEELNPLGGAAGLLPIITNAPKPPEATP